MPPGRSGDTSPPNLYISRTAEELTALCSFDDVRYSVIISGASSVLMSAMVLSDSKSEKPLMPLMM